MEFIKMHSLGNDFVIFQGNIPNNIKQICNRKNGIGCDQLMVTKFENNKILLNIFNQDGSTADMCGNGLRCIAGRYFDQNPNMDEVVISILPKNNQFTAYRFAEGLVAINMKKPIFDENYVTIGNKHAIIYLKPTQNNNILEYITQNIDPVPHPNYNKNYITIKNNDLYLITVERGVGETMACGSGSVASVCYAVKNSLLKPGKINVINKGIIEYKSQLFVDYKENEDAILIGDYKYSFEGKL